MFEYMAFVRIWAKLTKNKTRDQRTTKILKLSTDKKTNQKIWDIESWFKLNTFPDYD